MRSGRRIGLAAAGICSALALVAAFAQAQEASAYARIAVAQPASGATVFNNAGDVDVTVEVVPALHRRAGDRIALMLDGTQASVSGATASKLSGVARGEHTLVAQVLDSSGSVVIASPPVRFHLWQASRLFPGRREK